MNIAFIGCGFVADFYMATILNYNNLNIVKVYDRDKKRLKQFTQFYKLKLARSFDEIIQDKDIEMIINLTNPREHFQIIKKCLLNDKHVYTEKPLSMNFKDACFLYKLANKKKLRIASAPSSILSLTARTLESAIKNKIIGDVKLVYANFDAGMTHKMKPWLWKSKSGAFWPALDEFEVGCTFQHAGYFLTWLYNFFGPALKVTSFSKCLFADKNMKKKIITPDFSVGCIEFKKVVARVTLSVVAPLDRSLTIIGDNGVLFVPDIRNDTCPVYYKKTPMSRIEEGLEYRINHFKIKFENLINFFPGNWGHKWRFFKKYPFIDKSKKVFSASYKPVDFCNGPSELVQSIEQNKECVLSPEMALNVNEVLEVLQYPEKFQNTKTLISPKMVS